MLKLKGHNSENDSGTDFNEFDLFAVIGELDDVQKASVSYVLRAMFLAGAYEAATRLLPSDEAANFFVETMERQLGDIFGGDKLDAEILRHIVLSYFEEISENSKDYTPSDDPSPEEP